MTRAKFSSPNLTESDFVGLTQPDNQLDSACVHACGCICVMSVGVRVDVHPPMRERESEYMYLFVLNQNI